MTTDTDRRLLPDRKVRERYNVTAMTLHRWDRAPELGFPKPIVINNRKYRYVDELEAFERRRAAAEAA